jgi:hypothetical protein
MQVSSLNFWKIAAACTLAGVMISAAWSLRVEDRYVSRAVLRFAEPAGSHQEAWQRLQAVREDALSRHTLSGIITGQGLYARERTSQPLEEIIANMRNRDLRTMALSDSEFGVSFAADNPRQAQAAVSGVVSAIVEANLRVGRSHPVTLEVLEPASLPSKPAGPNRGTVIGVGLAVGLAFGILFGGVWSLVRSRGRWSWRRIAAFAAVGAVTGIAIAIRIPDEFISSAVLRAGDAGRLRQIVHATLSRDFLAGIIQKDGLYARERAAGGIDRAVEQMRNDIRVQAVENATAGAIVVSFHSRDRYQAQQVTRDLVTGFMKSSGTPVQVLDPPSMPQSPIFPNRPVIVAMGGFAGLVLGMGAAPWRRRVPSAAV